MTHAPNTGHIVRPPRVRLAALIVLMMMTCLAYIPAQPLPPVFLEESKNCSAEMLDGILSQCVDPLKASNIKSVANTLENLCLETSPCQAALRKLDIKACARVHDFSLLVRLEEYLPEAVSLCVKDKKGTYCKAKVIDTLDSASASCPKRTDKLSCRQAPECTWLQSCLRRPRKEEMDAACGECRTLLQMREADVLGYLAAAKRINPQTYDALGLMDS